MAAIEIDGLYRKFRLLIEYGCVADWEALGEHFGRAKPGTVKGWGQGNAGQARDRLPSRYRELFVKLMSGALPDGTPPERIQEIVFGPASFLEQALRALSPAALDRLLADEADRERIRLLRKPTRSGLVEREERGPDRSCISVPLDAFFRLECDSPSPIHNVIAIQQAQRLWGFVPAEADRKLRKIMLPGFRNDGSPDFMHERTQAGLHRFMVFQTTKAMPMLVQTPDRADIALDYETLAAIVAFYRAQPKSGRHLYLIEVMIGARDDAA